MQRPYTFSIQYQQQRRICACFFLRVLNLSCKAFLLLLVIMGPLVKIAKGLHPTIDNVTFKYCSVFY